MTLWETVVELLHEKPSSLVFRSICSLVDTWSNHDEALQTIPKIEVVLKDWSDELRAVPWTWATTVCSGEIPISWLLVRNVNLLSHSIGTLEIHARQLLEKAPVENLSMLHLHYMDRDATKMLVNHSSKISNIDCLYSVELGIDDSTRDFFASPLIEQLHTLDMYSFGHGVDKSQVYPLPEIQHSANNLHTLSLRLPVAFDVRPLFDIDKIPTLKKLILAPNWYGLFEENNPPDHLLDIVSFPVFTRLSHLELHDISMPFLTRLLERDDLRLNHLGIHGRYYVTHLVERQQFARRLTQDAVKVITKGNFLKQVSSLHISHERIGDSILQIIESTQTGRLNTLELIDVGLTDDGAKQLAQMPQLKGIRHLTLRSNPALTGKGLAALLSSPYLTELHTLSLGSDISNPYYGGSDDKISQYGTDLTTGLAQCSVLQNLESLTITFGILDVGAIEALVNMNAPNLRELNLSNNPIEAIGLAALSRASFFANLSQIRLDLCDLDNDAMVILADIEFKMLRELSLAYNSIGDIGIAALVENSSLSNLLCLNLHDNHIDDNSLMALAKSACLSQLIELDIEQDVWNYNRFQFSDTAAAVVSESLAFRNLDALYGGIVDEYHGDRMCGLFSNNGVKIILNSQKLRSQVRACLSGSRGVIDRHDYKPEAFQSPIKETPEEQEKRRREQDFRRYNINRRHG